MYQFTMSIDNKNAGWFNEVQKVLSIKVKNHSGIMAAKAGESRTNISVACENKHKSQIVAVIKDSIIEMYLTAVKFDYLKSAITIPALKRDAYKILLHTLVAFDRDSERDIVEKALKIGDSLALDGFFNFRLGELRKRWNEISALATNNAEFLTNDDTLNELLKFLMSAVSPKILKLDVFDQTSCYNIKGQYLDGSFEYKILNPEQLMIYLINIAPVELTLHGSFDDRRLYSRLVSIFDAKPRAGYSDQSVN